MAIFKFENGDVVRNVIKAHPRHSFYIYNSNVFQSEQFPSSSIPAYSIITKDGTLDSYKTITTSDFNSSFTYGSEITASSLSFYTSSLTRYYFAGNSARQRISGTLRNIFDYYKVWSPHYSYSSSLGDKSKQRLSLINIPSIYYGSKIKKGSLSLKYYFTGTLAGELRDENQNGELVQVGPPGSENSGSVAGVCFYNEGFVLLTGSWDITEVDDFGSAGEEEGKWLHFGTGINNDFPDSTLTASSFEFEFQGTTRIPSMTMFCEAPAGMLNYSSNPTFVTANQNKTAVSSSKFYKEPRDLEIKNVNKLPYNDPSGSFERVTYISQIQIYDEDKNLLGIAKLAKPVKKTEGRSFVFKVKKDL